MPLQLVEVQRLYEQVAEQIGNLIHAGEFRVGDRLPPERELAKTLGVSRPVVREAMIALEIAGLVEVRGGAGTFVKRARGDTGSLLAAVADPGPGPFDLIAARRLLEGEIAFSAAPKITSADIRSLHDAIEEMRADIAGGKDTRPADRLFHVRIVAALAKRNGAAARKAMRDHLAHVEKILMREELDAAPAAKRRPARRA